MKKNTVNIFIAFTFIFLLISCGKETQRSSGQTQKTRNPINLSYKVGNGQWEFPSDHLPRFSLIDFKNGPAVRVATLNVLNTIFKDSFIGNNGNPPKSKNGGTQGFSGTRLHTIPENYRNKELIEIIVDRIIGEGKTGIVALQEVGPVFFKDLKSYLEKKYPNQFHIESILNDKNTQDGGLIIFDTKIFTFLGSSSGHHFQVNDKFIQVLNLQHLNSGINFSLVNTHVPLNSSIDLIQNHLNILAHPLIAMGDMNETELSLGPKMNNNLILLPPFGTYYTHVNTSRTSVTYDHFIFMNLDVKNDNFQNKFISFTGPSF
jgi:hypothetical protein